MSEFYSQPEAHTILSDDDRLLTEVDHLVQGRLGPGVFEERVIADIRQNLEAAVIEQAMPYAVSETRHAAEFDEERRERVFRWMGKTAVENAMTGYRYHRHESARARVDVEVDEARQLASLEFGVLRVFISPRMTESDAPLHIAKEEHVGDDDAVRVSWLENSSGKVERVMQSLLVKDVPFKAWVAMLHDPDNMFGQSVIDAGADSALDVMRAHSSLELPKDTLENGPVSVLEAVMPYIDDEETRRKVQGHIEKFHFKDQQEMKHHAEAKAREWLDFEKSLAESLVTGSTEYQIRRFIYTMQNHWSKADLQILKVHENGDSYRMSRQLAAVVESAQQRLLGARTALLADEEFVLEQVKDEQMLVRMQDNERLIVLSQQQGLDFHRMTSMQNHLVADHDIKAGGGGCPGKNRTEFAANEALPGDIKPEGGPSAASGENDDEDPESWDWKEGVCRIESCKTRPGKTKVGPCNICKNCQKKFDAGHDPSKEQSYENKRNERMKPIAAMMLGTEKDKQFALAA